MHDFGEDYFERGLETRISLYQNYRFMPHKVFPLANMLKEVYGERKVILDYGCAKGFLVRALRLLNIVAYGYDISQYALQHAKDGVKEYLFHKKHDIPDVTVIFGKDVLEHIEKSKIDTELSWIRTHCLEACFVVPFGENKRYRIAEYGFDKTHLIIEDEEWWSQIFINNGFKINRFLYRLDGVKENWQSHHKYGNGIFFLK